MATQHGPRNYPPHPLLSKYTTAGRYRRSGAGRSFDRAVGTVRIDVERTRGSLDHFARDHDLFDAFQARKIEHGLEQDALEDRAQAPRAGLALDRPAGDRAKRLVGEGKLDILHL